MERQLSALLDPSYPEVSNLANAASFLFHSIDGISWAGFYYVREKDLALGPFCGKPACALLPKGRGVCWKAVEDGRLVNVPDVMRFEGHIACDRASRSELVIPLRAGGKIRLVLDLDSLLPARFGPEEEKALSRLAEIIARRLSDGEQHPPGC